MLYNLLSIINSPALGRSSVTRKTNFFLQQNLAFEMGLYSKGFPLLLPAIGKQKCSVFLTQNLSSTETPDEKPFIDGIVTRYRPGDDLKGNCTSQFSKPAANLTWTINDVPVGDETTSNII